ncbi:pilus assembly protein PilX [Noviherbaspirillum sp. UKPF54]|uniref:pilus assembly PilX family protein n=1 Tax=Noviherbaspirillum sp. UKPF54 TaxID=2601898 RepID=UPI0011B0FC30|nr:pilus assembly protein PilX [Noviherbaspirillum sp. UKPF54]QDZ26895.1 pilus assembly protein PilX [Noviherbaspirillum sp. UKPF54]
MMPRFNRHAGARRESGVVLILALIVLVAMTLAGLAMVRSVDTGNLVAGNLAFKQSATSAGDAGAESAIAWLRTAVGTATLYQDQAASGYYATSQDTLDLTGSSHDASRALVDWDLNNCSGNSPAACIRPSAAIAVAGGNSVNYIIHRLCKAAGDPNASGNSCATFKSSTSASPKRGELKYGDDKRFEPMPVEYYRITSRVKGPKNTVSFVETIVHF